MTNATKPATTPKPAKTAEEIAQEKQAKRVKFLELAPARVGKALKAVALIQNLGNATYDYEQQHVAAIVAALDKARTEVEAKLMARFTPAGAPKEAPIFTFPNADDAASTAPASEPAAAN